VEGLVFNERVVFEVTWGEDEESCKEGLNSISSEKTRKGECNRNLELVERGKKRVKRVNMQKGKWGSELCGGSDKSLEGKRGKGSKNPPPSNIKEGGISCRP